MAEFVEIMEQKQRMCRSYKHCADCGLSTPEGKSSMNGCDNYLKSNPQKAEEIIMKWANTHPIQTNADKFKEVFGIAVNSLGYEKNGCSCFMCSKYLSVPCTENDCKYKNFWGNEYETPS